MTTHYCNDSASRIHEKARADIVKPGEDKTALRLPNNATVVSRNSPLETIAVQRDVSFELGGVAVGETQSLDMHTICNMEKAAQINTAPLHRDASSDFGEGAGVNIENGVGVQPTLRSNTLLSSPVIQPQQKAARQRVIPQQQVPRTETIAVGAMPRQPASTVIAAQPAAPTPPPVDKIKLTMRSDRMGTHRLRVNKLSVSDTLLIIGYIDDDDAVIVEPPVKNSADDILTIIVDDKTYKCQHYGFTADMLVDGRQMLLVVLVRYNE